METKGYAIRTEVALPFDAALEKTKTALAEAGFGIIMNIDIAQKMKEKLGVSMGRYMILGACSPPHAHQALQAEPDIGLLLPCNVVVYEHGAGSVVAAINPPVAMRAAANAALAPLATDIEARLRQALARIEA
jgi:uncharacterized protein (DUF302 family)